MKGHGIPQGRQVVEALEPQPECLGARSRQLAQLVEGRPPRLEITGLPVSLAVVAPFQDVPQLEVERTESFPKVRLQSQKIAWGWGGGIPDLRDQPRLAPARPPLISLEFAMTFSSSPPRMKIREGETPGEPMEMACPQAV